MQTPSNVWQKCWQTALPIPVINQARLFNETNIAEEVNLFIANAQKRLSEHGEGKHTLAILCRNSALMKSVREIPLHALASDSLVSVILIFVVI